MYDYLKALHARFCQEQNFKKSRRNWNKLQRNQRELGPTRSGDLAPVGGSGE